MKKYQTYRKRKFSLRETLKKIIIITEGKKTEKIYFENFKTRNNGLSVKIYPAGDTDAKNIVEYALNKNNHSKWAFDKEKDELWCVYDIDENTQTDLIWVKDQETKFNFLKVVPSNPCIETWFSLHYEETLPRLSAQEMKSRLKIHNPNYKEKYDIYQDIKDNLEIAKNRAKKLNHKYQEIKLFDGAANPSTVIIKLIEKLKSV